MGLPGEGVEFDPFIGRRPNQIWRNKGGRKEEKGCHGYPVPIHVFQNQILRHKDCMMEQGEEEGIRSYHGYVHV